MDEWSVEYVERLRNQLNKGKQGTDVPALGALIRIIDHLDKQLAELKKVAEPIRFVVANMGLDVDDEDILYSTRRLGGQYVYLKAGHIRALDKAFEGVQDG